MQKCLSAYLTRSQIKYVKEKVIGMKNYAVNFGKCKMNVGGFCT